MWCFRWVYQTQQLYIIDGDKWQLSNRDFERVKRYLIIPFKARETFFTDNKKGILSKRIYVKWKTFFLNVCLKMFSLLGNLLFKIMSKFKYRNEQVCSREKKAENLETYSILCKNFPDEYLKLVLVKW